MSSGRKGTTNKIASQGRKDMTNKNKPSFCIDSNNTVLIFPLSVSLLKVDVVCIVAISIAELLQTHI
jgi:hypothetical protein